MRATTHGVLAGALVAAMAGALGGCGEGSELDMRPRVASARASGEPIEPLAAPTGLAAAEVALGRRLFHDPRLSRDGSLSCASCHDLATSGADGRRFPIGLEGRQGTVNAPTVVNAALNFRQYWDGRAADLDEQVEQARAEELGVGWDTLLARIAEDAAYRRAFDELYGGIEAQGVKRALATFERSLITGGARFDRWLEGDGPALSPDELEGYRLFKSYGCVACHQGAGVGGNMFQQLGVMGDYFADRGGEITTADLGRYNVTGDERDRHVFKVPSLRNVELTPPYFHDGSVATLEDAVRLMARYQLGRELTADEVARIVDFLRTLTAWPPPESAAVAAASPSR